MFKKILSGIILVLVGFFLGGATLYYFKSELAAGRAPEAPGEVQPTARALLEGPSTFAGVVSKVSPSVVNISTVRVMTADQGIDPFYDFFNDFLSPFDERAPGRNWREQGLGSGVVVSEDGYIITNNHVVADAEKIRVTLFDKRVFYGKVIGADPKTDLAVVKIDAKGLPALPWGDSDGLSVGEFVLAIGNPFGLSHTVTLGIVSAVGRADVGIADYEDFIQTDAAINPGNSGGPLVDGEGAVVGINTAIFSKSGGYQGIGFAVPSNMARLIHEQLVREGKVVRGWIGVSIQELSQELSRKFGYQKARGALVSEAVEGGPAALAGIRRGDVILSFDGRGVESPSELRNLVAQSTPGSRVPVEIFRKGAAQTLLTSVGEPPYVSEGAEKADRARPAARAREAFAGLSVMALTEDAIQQLGLARGQPGVVVIGVEQGSPADEAGLQRGDVVVEVEDRRVTGVAEYERAAARRDPRDPALLYINRGGRHFYVLLQPS